MRLILRNAQCFDTTRLDFVGERTIVIEDDRIVSVDERDAVSADHEIDVAGASPA